MTSRGSLKSGDDRISRSELGRVRKRAEYMALKSGQRFNNPLFTLQVRRRDCAGVPGQDTAPRFGYTVTTRVGGAVIRNRIRRRLKHAVAEAAPELAVEGHDHVLIARRAVVEADFGAIVDALRHALNRAASNPYPPHDRRRRKGCKSHISGQGH